LADPVNDAGLDLLILKKRIIFDLKWFVGGRENLGNGVLRGWPTEFSTV
jgi:hypothetical protein